MTKRNRVILAAVIFLFPFIFSGTSLATSPKVDIDMPSSTLNEGQSELLTFSLDEPIICEGEDVTCNVVLSYTSSDPASVSLSQSTITWTADDWYVPIQINVTALAPSSCATSELDTISATVVSNAAYYSNYQSSFTVTINSQPPYASPGINNQTVNLINNGSSINTDVTDGINGCPDPNSLTIVSGPSHGSAVDPPGSITYTPNAGYYGTDSLVYSVCSLLDSSVCSSATLTYNIANGSTNTTITPDTGYGLPTRHNLIYLYAVTVISALLIIAGITIANKPLLKRQSTSRPIK